jgi:glucan biosynthesis protein C
MIVRRTKSGSGGRVPLSGFEGFMSRIPLRSHSSLALSNLRAIVILIVLAFHSALAYVEWMPFKPASFDVPPYSWRAFPIVDSHRWIGFDIFCAWQNVYLMSLLFLLSGLFVWPSLRRKNGWGFARDRARRLGIPYVLGILVLLPIAFYPAYLAGGGDPNVTIYLRHYFGLPFMPNGQVWFLWQLLALNFIAAAVYWLAPGVLEALGKWSAALGRRPAVYFSTLLAISTVAYVPLALAFTPWEWSNSGIFSVQWCRPLLYLVYFFAGVGIGTAGLDVGLVAIDGELGRRWKLWLVLAIGSLFLWMGMTALTMNGPVPVALNIAAALCFVLACASGCFFFIASSLRFGLKRSAMLDSLSVNAYSLYLVHYGFGIWLQFALLGFALFALGKGFIVFGATLILSWVTILVVQRIPFAAQLIAAPPRTAAGDKAAPAAPPRQ